MSLVEWLGSINVKASEEIFALLEEEEVDLEALKSLSDAELKEMGFKLGDRSKIRKAAFPAPAAAPAAPAAAAAKPAVAKSVIVKKHEHKLEVSEEKLWTCDGCHQDGDGKTRYSCPKCDHDLCDSCELINRELPCHGPCYTSYHEHKIEMKPGSFLMSFFSCFSCDQCKAAKSGNLPSYRCVDGCDFDICEDCWLAEIGPDGPIDPELSESAKNKATAAEQAAPLAIAAEAKAAPAPTIFPLPMHEWTIKMDEEEIKFKMYPKATSVEILFALRGRFNIGNAKKLILLDQDGCDVVINHSMPSGAYDLKVL